MAVRQLWKKRERSRIRAMQMDNLRGFKRIDEGVLRWFGYVERMESNRIAKREESLLIVVQWIEVREERDRKNVYEVESETKLRAGRKMKFGRSKRDYVKV